MNHIRARLHLEQITGLSGIPLPPGVSQAQIEAAFQRIRMENLPFVSGSMAVIFFLYALIQAFILQENQAPIMVAIALASALLLLAMHLAARRGRLPANWSNWLYAIVTGLALLSMMLRLYFTGEPGQTSNLAFYLVAIGMLLLDTRWLLLIINITLAGWLVAALRQPSGGDWVFYGVVVFTAALTGLLAQVMLVRTYRTSEILRIVERRQRGELQRLYDQVRRFNQQLEEKVRQRTQALQDAYARLERLDKTKSDFIAIASHELRTPLTILSFHNQALLDDTAVQSNEAHLKHVRGIDHGTERIGEVVEMMLDVAKIDSQALDLSPGPLNLAMLLRAVGQLFRQALAERQITLDIEPLRHLPEIEADLDALQKVFCHLMTNAIKYTPDGGRITIRGQAHPADGRSSASGQGRVRAVEIIVQDTGIGIAPEAQSLIFEKFYQTGQVMLHSSGKTKFKGGGAGLGLAIARGIVKAHHGRIWAKSPGHDEATCPGSAFHVLLPVRQPASRGLGD